MIFWPVSKTAKDSLTFSSILDDSPNYFPPMPIFSKSPKLYAAKVFHYTVVLIYVSRVLGVFTETRVKNLGLAGA